VGVTSINTDIICEWGFFCYCWV